MAARRMPVWLAAPLWLLLALLGLCVAPLPRSVEMALGAWLGRLGLRLNRRHRRVAEENLRHCLPELSDAERARLLTANFEHYGRLIVELLHMFTPVPGHFQRWVRAHCRLHHRERWAEALASGKGAILYSAHTANWEMAIGIAGLDGFPAVMVTRHLTPDWLDRRLRDLRASVGIDCVYQPRTMPVLLRRLKDGGTVGFMADQYIPPPGGLKAPYFGVEVDSLGAMGPLAYRTGASLNPLILRRDEAGTLHLTVGEAMPRGEWMKDPAGSTRAVNEVLERIVRENPEQWLWAHRRFKNAVWPDGTKAYSAP